NYIREKGTTVSLAAERMYLDPVNTWKVIRKNGHKIGYLCYTDFVTDSHDKLAQVFAEFKSEGVTDLVLDLRYNPGGAALTPPYLASFIAPSSVLAEKTLFLSEDWNHNYNLYWSLIGENRSQYFHQDIPTNLNLNRVYVLTTSGSASASEATISGLMPYMNVVKIGTTTHGKYCGAALLQFRDKDNKLVKDLENWAMSLIVYRFINKDGFTEFKNGIAPDYEVEDDIFDTYPLGDVKDPHLAKAIELITGNHSPVLSGIRTPKAPEGSTRLPFEQTRRYPLYGNMVDVIE
ncbi:hypothetical protein LJC62_04900, partial [Odoribacter sp. OttesenSCG-928-A06]|nr:hypothetical protein [Odoribacter sp. OttesenSCG-928-A06]